MRLVSDDPAADPLRLVRSSRTLSNAVKFTPKRGRVEVNVATRGSSALVTVRDTGADIDPEFQGRIFERFRQQQPSPGV